MTKETIKNCIEFFITERAKAHGDTEIQNAINETLNGLYNLLNTIQKRK